jgi:hypothetical protein
MMYNVFAWWFNQIERQRQRELYSDLHRDLYAHGFTHQISFYGTLKSPYDDKHVQARIELLTDRQFTPRLVRQLRETFRHFRPAKEYTMLVLLKDTIVEAVPG